MEKKLIVILLICTLFMGCASSSGPTPVTEDGNFIQNGDFARFGSEWPNLPFNWRTTWKGGDGFEPIKTEAGRFIGWAQNIYSFTLFQDIRGLTEGKYNLSAELRLNPDSEVGDIVMNVYSGSTLAKSRSVRAELLAAPRETDVLFELTDIDITGSSARVEFAATNILNYIGIDNVRFSK